VCFTNNKIKGSEELHSLNWVRFLLIFCQMKEVSSATALW